jgi:hypothetical protein
VLQCGVIAQANRRAGVRAVLFAAFAVMNSPLTVIDPAAPRCCNPIAIGANRDELGYG